MIVSLTLYYSLRVNLGRCVSVIVTQKWLADWLIENNPNKAKLHDWMGCAIIPPS